MRGCGAYLVVAALLVASFVSSSRAADGQFVAVGYAGRRIVSADGFNWTDNQQWAEKGGHDDNILADVAFGRGRIVAVGGSEKGRIIVSEDGRKWRELDSVKGRVQTVTFGNGRFVAANWGKLLVSDDGERWTFAGKATFRGGIHERHAAFGNGRFVIIGDCDPDWKNRTGFRATTVDGTSYDNPQVGKAMAHAIAFGNGRFVVVGEDGLRECSVDGVKWEHTATDADAGQLNGVVWDGKRFVAAGAKACFTSPDGETWTRETHRVRGTLLCHAGGVYIAAQWPGRVFASRDLAEWKQVVNATGDGTAITSVIWVVAPPRPPAAPPPPERPASLQPPRRD